jgi:hypothetical protein
MSSTPAPQPAPGGPPATPPPTAGGSKVFLWILGGCATIVVLGILVFVGLGFFAVHKFKQAVNNPVMTAAKFMVAANPDLETVSSDDSTIVVRDRKTGKASTMKVDPEKKIMVVTDENGKTVTMKLDPANNRLVMTDEHGKTATITADTQAGNLEIKAPDGSMKLGSGADKPPGWIPAYPGSTPQGSLSFNNATEQSGSFGFVTSDAPDKVLSYYGNALKSGGFKVTSTTTNTDGKVGGTVSGQNDGQKRSAAFIVSTDNSGTHVSATYSEKKQN